MVLADPGLIVPVAMGPLWNCPRVVLGMVQADRAISIAFDGLYRSGFRDLVDHEVTPPAHHREPLIAVNRRALFVLHEQPYLDLTQ
jgi:hypothetical protein